MWGKAKGKSEAKNQNNVRNNMQDDISNKYSNFQAIPNDILKFVEKHAYAMFALHIDRMCEQIASRGFSFNNVIDPLSTTSNGSLFDLQSMLIDETCHSLANKDTLHKILHNENFLSINEIVKRKYIGDARFASETIDWCKSHNSVHGKRVFYAFCFDMNSGAMPSTRQKLLGIIEVVRQEKTQGAEKKIVFTANFGGAQDKDIEFDKKLVFSMPYGEYLNVFLLGFENIVMMLLNTKNKLGAGDYKIFTDNSSYLNKDQKDYEKLLERIRPFINGETKSIIMSSDIGLEIQKGDSAEEVQNTNLTLGKNIMSFLTSIPASILFGENIGGLNSSKEQDKMQQEEFLTSKARLDFLPILQTFCDLFSLKGRDNLDFISYFESMRVLSLTKDFDEDIVDDAIKYKIREAYYKMLNMDGTPPPITKERDLLDEENI